MWNNAVHLKLSVPNLELLAAGETDRPTTFSARLLECPHQFELSGFLVGKPAESNLNNTPLCLVSASASVVCPYVRRIFNVLFRLVTSFQMSCKPPAKEENRNGKKTYTKNSGKETNYNFHQWNEDNKNVYPFLFWFLLHCEDCAGTRPHAIIPVSPSHRITSLAALLKRLITSEIVTVDKFHQVNPTKKSNIIKKGGKLCCVVHSIKSQCMYS
jgi:hypothetical protein